MAEAREPRPVEMTLVVDRMKVRLGADYAEALFTISAQDVVQEQLIEENEGLRRQVADLQRELATLRGDSADSS